MNRRSYLAAVTAITTVSLSGCSGSDVTENTSVDLGNGDDESEQAIDGPQSGETFDDFEDLGEWAATSGTLYRVVDEEPYSGSQSALIEADESDNRLRIVRELSPPVDLSGMRPGLALATNGGSPPLIQLFTDNGGRIDFRRRSGGNRSLVRKNFGIDEVVGEPDLSAVTEIQIGMMVGEGGEGTQLWLDDLYFVSRHDPGTVLLQFDGGYETQYTDGLPVLEEYGYPAMVFVTPDRIREEIDHDGDRLTEDQLDELHDAGWTVGSFSARGLDLTDLRDRTPAQEISLARTWLEDHGYEDGARYFSYPRGRYNDEIFHAVEENHEIGFTGRYPAHGTAANPLVCSKITHPDADQAKRAIDLTAEMGGITALNYLDIGDESREALEETVAHLHDRETNGDLEVVTADEIDSLILGE